MAQWRDILERVDVKSSQLKIVDPSLKLLWPLERIHQEKGFWSMFLTRKKHADSLHPLRIFEVDWQ